MTKTTLLAILQQSEYSSKLLRQWVTQHQAQPMEVNPPKWTTKLKVINALSSLFFFMPNLNAIELALSIVTPGETLIRWLVYTAASIKLIGLRLMGLKVIAIAGSYAKTSTKHILFHTLSATTPTLMTPHSYNTLLGIAQVILKDLQPQHKLFIVEFGEYHPQDIPNLTRFIRPDWGILTPIGRQHLAIIGGFDQLVKTFRYFVDYFNRRPQDVLIADHNREHLSAPQASWYGTSEEATLRIINASVTRAGTEFELSDKTSHQTYQVFTPLFGEHQAVNMATAIWVAAKLKIEPKEVVKRLSTMPYIHRRHEPTFAEHEVLILDNSYNTNAESIKESLKLLNQLKPTNRIVITLGFTELGDQAETIHRELGQLLAKQADYVGLIKAPWTSAIIEGFIQAGGAESHIKVGDSQTDALAQVQSHITSGSVVLFEGGYQEVYV